MAKEFYKEAFQYAMEELKKEYISKNNEDEFTFWFKMEYVEDTVDTITVSVVSDFMNTMLSKKGYFVHCKQDADKNRILLSGTYVAKSGEQSAFVASIDTLHNVKWLKTFKQGEGNRSCLFVSSSNDDIAAIVTSISKAGNIRNFMILLDKAGNQKQSVEIKIKALPRKLLVDDIDNKYVVMFCGSSIKPFVNETCQIHFCCFDSKFKTLWDKQLQLNGYTCNVLKTDNVYYLLGAFTKMQNLDNEDVDLNGNFGLFIYSIDADGNWLVGENYESNQSIYPMWISKCNNTTFEVVSALGEPRQTDAIKAAYMQFTFDGKEIYSSIDKQSK